MELKQFLNPEVNLENYSTLCFVGTVYSPLLYVILKKFYENKQTVVLIETLENDASLKALLEISFLGMSRIYWMSTTLLQTHPSIVSYIISYKGPHTVAFFNEKTLINNKNEALLCIEIPQEVDYSLFLTINNFLNKTNNNDVPHLAKNIFKKYLTIPFENLYLILQYLPLIKTSNDIFIQQWLPYLITPEKSLFKLSTNFFAKKGQLFFELLDQLELDYNEVFWLTFWSDQLFKSYAYIKFMKNNNFVQAKRIAHRLPFSFIQKDWKTVQPIELKKAHDYLYTLDWNMKNQLSTSLNFFYMQFFLNEFK